MTFGKTALRCWLPAAALLLALLCPLPVAAARAGTAIPVSVRTDGAAADAVYTVELTPLDAAPAPVQRALTVKNGGTVYFTGFAFDEPGDYRYLVAERSGGAAHTTYDLMIGVVEEKAAGMTVRPEDKEFIANFYKYAFVGLTLEWVRTGMKDDPAALIERVSTLIHGDITKALEACRIDK